MAQLSTFAPARPEEILLPARPWFVVLTLFLGLMGNTMPVSGITLAFMPDFLALVLLVRVVGGAPLPRWTYVMGPLVGAFLWPVVTVLLQWPQRPRRQAER